MKRISNICFIVICFLLCVIPSLGMFFYRTDVTTENKRMATFPVIMKNDKVNWNYLKELGAYFEDHFAFRQELVTADAEIQSKMFKVSNVDTVMVGKDGWLYYTDTLDDYLGRNVISDRGAYNVAHNLSLMQQYVESFGSTFLFTIAPNKNSLYGEHMPYYYSKKESDNKDLKMVAPKLLECNINYVDLFSVFENQEEILYLKRDSHWNNKGAVLAYNAIMDTLEREHETYETIANIRTKTEIGDLNKMMYPLSAKPEFNYYYENETRYQYITETQSVEDAWIQTSNASETQTLLMFRDSFGNTLLPFMANAFGTGYFSKSMPYSIEKYMNQYQPDIVVAQKVERNIREFAENPPLMNGREVDWSKQKESTFVESNTTFSWMETELNTDYWCIKGQIDEKYCDMDTNIYVKVSTGDKVHVYEAYTISDEITDYGYLLYVSKDKLPDAAAFEILICDSKGLTTVYKTEGEVQNEMD